LASHDYRPDIDGLRAFAIIPVLFFHAGVPGLDGGFVGVDVFFVISGYLISRLIYAELDEQRFSIIGFYERRARRIAPAFFAVSLLTFVAAALVLFPTRLVEFCKSLLWSSLAVGNVYFWQESGYFGPEASAQPLLHYWSLGVEEQFYLLFPALAMLIWKWGKARLAAVLAVIFVLSLIASELMVRHSPEAAFYLLPFRAWELLAGSLLAMRTVPPPPTSAIATGAVTAGIGLIIASIFLLSEQTTFPGLGALLPVAGSALAIWGGQRSNTAADALGLAPLVYIGRISYSLYLVHWPVLFFATRLISETGAAARTTLIIAVSMVLADLSYRFVETPTRRRSPFWTPARIFALTATGVLIGAGLSLATILAGGFSGRLPAGAQALLAYRYDRVAGYREGACFLRREQPASALADECLPTRKPVALIWGDSHAAHFLPGLKPALEAKGYAVAQITASGCPPIRGFEAPRRANCRAISDFALDWIHKTKPSLVLLSAIWTRSAPSRTIPSPGILFPRHHHAARQCARLPPRDRRAGASLCRPRSTRSPASRRAASSSAARSRTSFRPASCRSARRASCRTRPCASPTAWNTASTRWRCTRTRCPGEKVILVDDLIATGGTAEGAVKLLRQIGAEVVAACFVIDLPDLGGRKKLEGSACRCGR
jgi:peptidoglycan/LPS O-acetylase OafA/YrhL